MSLAWRNRCRFRHMQQIYSSLVNLASLSDKNNHLVLIRQLSRHPAITAVLAVTPYPRIQSKCRLSSDNVAKCFRQTGRLEEGSQPVTISCGKRPQSSAIVMEDTERCYTQLSDTVYESAFAKSSVHKSRISKWAE